MAYRRDPKGRRTTRLLVVTTLSIAPVIHGCGIETAPGDDGNGEALDGGNPKGSFYDDAMLDAATDAATDAGADYMLDGDAEPDAIIFSNPKGCFFDEGLIDLGPDQGDGGEPGDAGGSDAGESDGGGDASQSDAEPDGA